MEAWRVNDTQVFTRGKQLSDYQNDAMLRAAIERSRPGGHPSSTS